MLNACDQPEPLPLRHHLHQRQRRQLREQGRSSATTSHRIQRSRLDPRGHLSHPRQQLRRASLRARRAAATPTTTTTPSLSTTPSMSTTSPSTALAAAARSGDAGERPSRGASATSPSMPCGSEAAGGAERPLGRLGAWRETEDHHLRQQTEPSAARAAASTATAGTPAATSTTTTTTRYKKYNGDSSATASTTNARTPGSKHSQTSRRR